MDAPLVLYQPLFLSTTSSTMGHVGSRPQAPGRAGAHGVTWKKRGYPSENHTNTHTHTHEFAQSGLQHTPSEKNKRQWKVP